jgi:uncharacterized protein YyaL (SSP411 family)
MSKNHLAQEKSLYLKQHAENPVHWYPYGEEALNKAKELNRLIFISVGYSSCHWCHVMAHESFEDEKTAEFLNKEFISIKVDREEFPDLDNYLQTACSIATGRGGWPLTAFLTPDGKPFFIGTYFPLVGREGMPSFMEVSKHIANLYQSNPDSVKESAEKLSSEIIKPFEAQNKIEFQGHFPHPSAILNALKNYADTANGGYGKAPKFPHFAFYEWACEQILEGMIPKEQGSHIVESLEKMLMGGLFDHAKGGIHRYSTDEKFLVPHFEKMLYDQAGLLKVLSKLSQFYPAPIVFDGLLQTLDYLKSEMLSDDGFFFSAQDADSEGTEGLYFTFSKEEFEASFEEAPPEQRARIDHYLEVFNISERGNFEHGLNVISLNPKFKNEFYSQDGWIEIREIRRRLLEKRKERIPPATDRKGISGWNYMLLSALADVVQYCPVDVIRDQAIDLIQSTVEGCLSQFIVEKDSRHVLRHVNTLTNSALYLEDYVSFAEAQFRLYEITGNDTFKKNAFDSTNFILQNFIKDEEIFITSFGQSTPGIENLTAPFFDQSYRSSAMTLIHLLSRLSVFNPELSPDIVFKKKFPEYAQFVLLNPHGHGEGLKALTYPLNIFRKVEVPRSWLAKKEFIDIRSHFFGRFVMNYHERDDEGYEICTKLACEISGKGLENFKILFENKEESHA